MKIMLLMTIQYRAVLQRLSVAPNRVMPACAHATRNTAAITAAADAAAAAVGDADGEDDR